MEIPAIDPCLPPPTIEAHRRPIYPPPPTPLSDRFWRSRSRTISSIVLESKGPISASTPRISTPQRRPIPHPQPCPRCLHHPHRHPPASLTSGDVSIPSGGSAAERGNPAFGDNSGLLTDITFIWLYVSFLSPPKTLSSYGSWAVITDAINDINRSLPYVTCRNLRKVLTRNDLEHEIASKAVLEALFLKAETPHRQRAIASEVFTSHRFVERAYKYRLSGGRNRCSF